MLKQSRLWGGRGVRTEFSNCWNNGASQTSVVRLHFQCRLSSFSCHRSETPWGHDGRGQLVVWRRKWRFARAVFSQGETHRAHNSLLFKIKFITLGCTVVLSLCLLWVQSGRLMLWEHKPVSLWYIVFLGSSITTSVNNKMTEDHSFSTFCDSSNNSLN